MSNHAASAALFQFKAGRVKLNDTTGHATPLAGPGHVVLMASSEDPSLLGMQWVPRGSNTTATASEELLLVPGDVEFTKVPECSTGRVIQMRFFSSGERQLFWLQTAPKGDLLTFSEEDEKVLAKLNELANTHSGEEQDEEEPVSKDEEMADH